MEFYGTIGPACAQLETLQRMVEAGMTGIRMNLSHGPLSAHKDWLDIIHAVGIPQLLIDLQGPELRVGRLASPVTLPEGGTVQLGAGGIPCPVQLVQAARRCPLPGGAGACSPAGPEPPAGRRQAPCAGGRSRWRCPAVYCGTGRHPAKPQKPCGTGADGGLPHVDGGGPAKPAVGRSLRRYRGDAALRAGG